MHTPNSLKNYLKNNYFKLSIITFSLGSLFLALQKEWIVVRSPFAPQHNLAEIRQNLASTKQKLIIYYWADQRWNCETTDAISTNNRTKDLKHLVTSWLNLLSEEKILCQKPALQSVLLDQQAKNLYLSFDRALFTGTESTKEKLLIIESLLKTIREHQTTQPAKLINKFSVTNQIAIETITFLVAHQSMSDTHLDFTISWPIKGFLG
jgi:hypothetical protein